MSENILLISTFYKLLDFLKNSYRFIVISKKYDINRYERKKIVDNYFNGAQIEKNKLLHLFIEIVRVCLLLYRNYKNM